MVTLRIKAAHLVNRKAPYILCLFVILVISFSFCFQGQDLGSDCNSSWSLLTFHFCCRSLLPVLMSVSLCICKLC